MTGQNRRRSAEQRVSREPRDSGTAGAPPAIDGAEAAPGAAQEGEGGN